MASTFSRGNTNTTVDPSNIDVTQLDWSNVETETTIAAGDSNPNPIFAMDVENEEAATERVLIIKQ